MVSRSWEVTRPHALRRDRKRAPPVGSVCSRRSNRPLESLLVPTVSICTNQGHDLTYGGTKLYLKLKEPLGMRGFYAGV